MKRILETITNDKYANRIGIVLVIISFIFMGITAYIIAAKTDINVEYKGAKWYEVYDTTLPELPKITVPDNTQLPQEAVSKKYEYGNLPEISAMDIAVCADDNWYYLADPSDGYRLIRVRKNYFPTRSVLADLPVRDINVMNDRISFTTSGACNGMSQGIYNIGTDGSDLRLLRAGDYHKLQQMNDRLYYIRGNDRHLCRLDINGRNEIDISNAECAHFLIAEGQVIAILYDSSSDKTVVCSMDADGDEKKNLAEYGEYDALGYEKGRLYYVTYDQGYGVIDIMEDSTASANNAGSSFIRLKGIHSAPFVYEGRLWYIDRLAGDMLTVFDMSESKRYGSTYDGVRGFCILDGMLIVEHVDDKAQALITSCSVDTGESIGLYGDK